MIINTNISALNSYRNTKGISNLRDKASARLSSGLKINNASDDAAGLAISEKMRAQIRGLYQANDNVAAGINLIQTAEGGLSEIQNMVQRARELIIQALNDTNTDDDKNKIQQEIEQLMTGIDSIANGTEFNTIPLLNRSGVVQGPEQIITVDTSTIFTKLAAPPLDVYGQFIFKGILPDDSDSIDISMWGGTVWPSPVMTLDVNGFSNYYDYGSGIPRGSGNTGASITQLTTQTSPNTWEITYMFYGGSNSNEQIAEVTNRISLVDNPAGIGGQSYHISYDFKNLSTTEDITLNFDIGFNTVIGETFALHPYVNGTLETGDSATGNIVYSGSAIPEYVEFYDEVDYPICNVVATIMNGTGLPVGNEPDVLEVGEYVNIGGAVMSSLPNYTLKWQDRTIAAGETYTLDTYFGVKNTNNLGEIITYTPLVPGDDCLYLQTGANSGQGTYVNLCDARADALGLNGMATKPRSVAETSLTKLDTANDTVSGFRSRFGAYQNRLEYIEKSNSITYTNLQDAESRIRDADMAREYMTLLKANVLTQAGMSILAQANQSPELVLSLLK